MTGTKKKREDRGARVRTCAGCGAKQDKAGLLRIVRTPEGCVLPDPEGKRDGRGVYLCRRMSCLERAQKRKSLERSLGMSVPKEVYEALREGMEDHGTE